MKLKRVMRLVTFRGTREWVDDQTSMSIEHSHKLVRGTSGHPERTEEIRVLNLQAVPTRVSVPGDLWTFERIIVYIGRPEWVDAQVNRAITYQDVGSGVVTGVTIGDIDELTDPPLPSELLAP